MLNPSSGKKRAAEWARSTTTYSSNCRRGLFVGYLAKVPVSAHSSGHRVPPVYPRGQSQ